MNRKSVLVDVGNYFIPTRYENLKQVLENGKLVEIYVNCIGHTRAVWVEQEYAENLKKEYGERLVVNGCPGDYGTTYRLKKA